MDKLTEMVVFVEVVESRSFTAAATKLGITKSVASKYVTRLEDRLGVRLLNRTTRRLSLTEAGSALYQGGRAALDEIATAERSVSYAQAAPRGRLRINAPMSFGILRLGPIVPEFLAAYPEIALDVNHNDRFIDVIEEGYDVTLRITNDLGDSRLVARKLTPIHFVVCAAPPYLERNGAPQTPQDLAGHNCLIYTLANAGNVWDFAGPSGSLSVSVSGNYHSNSSLAIRDMLMAGAGVARMPTFVVGEALQRGLLIPLLNDYATEPSALYTVYPPNRYLSPKARVFVDYVVARFAPPAEWDRSQGLWRGS